jgi:hypothetical protein
VVYARQIARWLDRRTDEAGPEVARRRLSRVTLLVASVHLLVWLMGWPWPHRFSAAVVILLVLAWAASTPGILGRGLRNLALGLMPETGGRGLWSGRARRRILEGLVAAGDPALLQGAGTGLVVSALAVDRGLVTHFVSWPEVIEGFERRIRDELGEVVHLRDAAETIAAAVASSAIPRLPARARRRPRVRGCRGIHETSRCTWRSRTTSTRCSSCCCRRCRAPVAASPPGDVVALGSRLLELATGATSRPSCATCAGMEPRRRIRDQRGWTGARVRGRARRAASGFAAPVRPGPRRTS